MKNKQEPIQQEKKSIKEKYKEKRDLHKQKKENWQLFLAFLGAVFFVASLINSLVKSDMKESDYFPFIVALTILYVVIFVIYLFVHRNNKDDIKEDTKNFKSGVKLVKLSMNLIFVLTAFIIFLESVQGLSNDASLFVYIKTGVSGVFVIIKLLSALSKLIKFIKKKAKK